jgi:hypothetical protein
MGDGAGFLPTRLAVSRSVRARSAPLDCMTHTLLLSRGCTRRDGFAPGAIGETYGPSGLAGAGRSLGA